MTVLLSVTSPLLRPITYSTPMVLAIDEGIKSVTRRQVHLPVTLSSFAEFHHLDVIGQAVFTDGTVIPCPYGKVGDLLYIREEHYRYGHWEEIEGVLTPTGQQKWKFVADSIEVLFDPPVSYRKGLRKNDPYTPSWYKRLARFMPKVFARTVLKVKEVRLEYLQDISEQDAVAEGIFKTLNIATDIYQYSAFDGFGHYYSGINAPIHAFRDLWEYINGMGSWQANPLVWVVEFQKTSLSPTLS